MNRNEKSKMYCLLISIIVLNLYVVYRFHKTKEGFIGPIINGVLEIIPIPAIKDFLQDEVDQGGGGFKAVLNLAIGIFKLIVLVGIMPFLLMFVAKAVSLGGMLTVKSFIFKFVSFMFSKRKVNMDAFTMDNQKQIESLTQKVEHLKNNPCCEKN
tara:strand:+ start:2191 stop:2655 length:465 start_codon:yes stop_codon:yes gene_type:complete